MHACIGQGLKPLGGGLFTAVLVGVVSYTLVSLLY
jgi:hypothetical protein